MAADAAADTMTKRCIAAPSESLSGTVRTYGRLGVARSARASEGALVMTKMSRYVHTEPLIFCQKSYEIATGQGRAKQAFCYPRVEDLLAEKRWMATGRRTQASDSSPCVACPATNAPRGIDGPSKAEGVRR
jgi:hypothetical protein